MDAACKQHDIAYSSNNPEAREIADKKLQREAFKRVFAKDSSLGERTTALAVTAAMKARRLVGKVGGEIKPKKKFDRSKSITFTKLVREARAKINMAKPDDVGAAAKMALAAVKKRKRGKIVSRPRTIKLPTHSGGVLPLIPIFAGLSALGSITG